MILKSLWTISVLYMTSWHPAATYQGLESASYMRSSNMFQQHEIHTSNRPSPEEYNWLRDKFYRCEESKSFGADVELTSREVEANKKIMTLKTKEYENGMITPRLFTPSQHFFKVLDDIRQSPLFKLISKMPKGGVLHAHDTALCSTDFLVKLTYRDNLWGCSDNTTKTISALRFAKVKPDKSDADANCTWNLMSKLRVVNGTEHVDQYLRDHLTMYPVEKFPDNNEAWNRFMSIFRLLAGLLFYVPVWADYYYNALEEFYVDGVQYLEFRSTLPSLYDLDGNVYPEIYTVSVYKETLDTFMAANPNFIGSKLIYAPTRNINDEGMEHFIKTCIEIKAKFPDFLAGFDLVGQEEPGRPLKDFIPQLLNIPDNIDFFFHAGETNWYGSDVDENLIDAVLLGSKRIGHGFALVKHPLVLQMIKERNIAVEVNPISNQVLQLVSDFRNHPCTHLFADNYPVVISSDDPSFWKATPLSHDFYIAFLGIASAHSDLRLLKKLAMNSINYSSLSPEQKIVALQKWQAQWDVFIADIVIGDNDNKNYNTQIR
ncbi:adenosine deaminase 2-like, partial [Musca vetustissima]|uniref:adenosine deaminase 2-like n=1 Tax=Musca vetustissima TaxID=27455 RepID=UPI002AB73542